MTGLHGDACARLPLLWFLFRHLVRDVSWEPSFLHTRFECSASQDPFQLGPKLVDQLSAIRLSCGQGNPIYTDRRS